MNFYYYFFVFEGDEKDVNQIRRRLSVMSDNKLVEGFDSVNLDGGEEVNRAYEV